MNVASRAQLGRTVIVTWKMLFGGFDFMVGFALLFVSEKRLERWAHELMSAEFTADFGDRLMLLLDSWLPALIDRKTSVALVLLVWGTVIMATAVGFLLRRPWGYYAMLALAGSFLLLDTPHLFARPSLFAGGLVVVNAFILLILVRYRRFFR